MTKLDILYEDNHLVVAVKPFNMLSQSDITKDEDMLTVLKSYIKEKYNKPGNVYLGLVHRLDRPTSGIMVFARTSKAASRLSEEIRNHQFNKEYIAVVHGILDQKSGIMKDYMKKIDTKAVIVDDKEDSKYAELSYNVLKEDKNNNLSLVEINLKTGRYNQIRCQFASRNHPLYGDNKYGYQDKKQLCLIAKKLEFHHPITKELMSFTIDYDKNMPGFNIF